jgi:hypothetical protein
MMFGLSLANFTLLHVVLSLIGIVAGFVVVAGIVASRHYATWTAVFLATTVLTSVTGFLFPFERILPSHVVGVISLVALAVALAALYATDLAGRSRWLYVIAAVASLYLNVFVLVVQAFLKVPALNRLAPTQAEPPFVIAQGVVLVAFVAMAFLGVRRFRPDINAGVLRAA